MDNKKRSATASPYLGLLGFMGFLGFLGVYTYRTSGMIFPFIFFGFFGFFAFFFAGKMSGTLMDERFETNRLRAERNAYRAGFWLAFAALWLSDKDFLFLTHEAKLIFLYISLSLIIALTMILSQYLLYRYDCLGEGE